jgi:DNA-binding beta-propeller fold protein YncE
MKKIYLLTLALALIAILSFAQQDNPASRMKKLWETGPGLKVPESVLYDSVSGKIFVSNINGNSAAKDTNGFISILSSDGRILYPEWVKGLDAPKGMGILKNHLFVTNINEIVEIDISTATILNRFFVEGSTFLNDIAIDPKTGMIFISDSRGGKVYIMKNGQAFTWFEGENVKGANGLFIRDGFLYIGTSTCILKATIGTNEIVLAAKTTSSVDGLFVTSDNKYIYSDWKGSVYLTSSSMTEPEVLNNTSELKINAADFGIIISKKLILVPTFLDNKVVCYSLPDIR